MVASTSADIDRTLGVLPSVSGGHRTVAVLLVSDLLTLLLVSVVVVLMRLHFGGEFELRWYWRLWPCLLLFPFAYETAGLYHGVAFYPGVAFGPAEEIRRVTYATSVVFVCLGVATFLAKSSMMFSRLIFVGAWGLSVAFVPLMRQLVRALFAKQSWWGVPSVICGAGETGVMVTQALVDQPAFGIRPVAILDDDREKQGREIAGVPVVGPLSLGPSIAAKHNVRHAILAMPGIEPLRLRELLAGYEDSFSHLLLIPNLFGFSSLWVRAQDLGGILGLEVRQQLLLPSICLFKSVADVTLAILTGAVLLPLIGLIAVLVKCTSAGPVFYGAQRLGRGGTPFTAWKFRTMVRDSDRVLAGHLAAHPEKREEWERRFKLRDDPRVTSFGRLLRKSSLDELPQLWNVMKGEMSLVGPRPIVEEEIGYYQDGYETYKRVRPGVTGLWQTSGRSETSYAQRVALDLYYVRNWSVWLDVYILARTVAAVVLCRGAY